MAYPFAAAEVLTAVDLNAMIGAPTQNAITTVTYTAVLLDAGKTVTLSNASAVTLTIPAQASVSWADDTQLNFLNLGAGTVTITAAAGVTINGTPLTLATSKGGSLVRTASNTWTFTPTGGGGKVLQVVSVTKTDTFSTSSTSFVDVTGLTANITPSSASSKIMVFVSLQAGQQGNNGYFNLVRGSTNLAVGDAAGSRVRTSAVLPYQIVGNAMTGISIDFLDSPSATVATTYKVQVRAQAATVYVNRSHTDADGGTEAGRTASTITLMEIGA